MKEVLLYNKTIKILFDENRHMYFNDKKEHLMSVTTATGVVDKSGPLMGWAVKMAKNYLIDNWKAGEKITESEKIAMIEEAGKQHRIFKKKAADIGTQIHEWAENWIKGRNPEMPKEEKVVNGITAFLKFNQENKVKWKDSERFVYSKKHNYCGILDAVGRIGKELVLIDFKSSNGIYDEMRFQVAAYQLAYEEETEKKIDRSIILRFGKEDGEFEVKELPDYNKDKKAFLACLELKRRLKELSKY